MESRAKNLAVRSVAGVGVFCVLFLGTILFWVCKDTVVPAKTYMLLLTMVLSMASLYEFYSIYRLQFSPLGIAGYLVGLGYWLLCFFRKTSWSVPLLIGGMLLIFLLFILTYSKRSVKDALLAVFGVVYTVLLFSFLYRLWGTSSASASSNSLGVCLFWLVFIAAWGSDTFAYFTGSLIGKHKMAPVLSPKKSWEGFFGGLAGSVLLSIVFGIIFRDIIGCVFPHPILFTAFCGLFGSIASVFGDLTASAFKRDAGAKDYSHLIPGHGGILDRFDSVLFVAPVIYYGMILYLHIF